MAVIVSQAWLALNLASLRARVTQQEHIQTLLLSIEEPPIKLQPTSSASRARGFYRFETELGLGLLNYYQLPAPGPAGSYQCWFEFPNNDPLGCGRLPLDPDGHGILLTDLPAEAPTRVRVTLEGETAARPQGPTIFIAELDAAPAE